MDNHEILFKVLEKENKLLKENYEKLIHEKYENIIKEQDQKYKELEIKYNNEKKEKEELFKELESIKYSRSYKLTQKIKKIVKK